MGIEDLEYHVLDPGEDISVTSLAEYARDEGGYSRFVLLDARRGKEVADAARFFEARKVKHGSKDLEEDVNRSQGVIMPMEIARSGLLATIERKQKLRFGALKETEEALFRYMKVLDDVMSEMEKVLREAGERLVARQAGMEKDRSQRAEGGGCCSKWQRWDPLASPGSASTGKAHWRIKAPRAVL